ncbi:alginate lyase family protein [Flavobacterium faecale]|uniref:alginate lyase family protein n=1 Tax=Flavobacterium faecale TaxID=1355330 RepID=UPI003AAFD0C7
MKNSNFFFKCLSVLFLTLTVFTLDSYSQELTNFNKVKTLEELRIINDVKKYFDLKPLTITSQGCNRSAGTKNDFYSEGDYWWPDDKNPEGPYVRKDGLTNPDNFVAHRELMIRLSQISGALTSAYLVTKDDKYILKLFPHLNAWFIDASTKMNPHLLYGQAIKGIETGRGIGIIDTVHLIEVALAIEVVEDSKLMNIEDLNKIKVWFSQYLNWLTSHPYGKQERDNGNNHSTCWAMQVAAFARLVNNQEQIQFCKNMFKTDLLPNQMAQDGSFPKELARTKPYGYSLFNLDAMAALAQMLSDGDENLFQFTTSDGKNLKIGIEFLYKFVRNKSLWPYPEDVMYWNDWPTKHPFLLFGGLKLKNKKYIKTWKQLSEIPDKAEILRNMPVRYPLLWVYRT